MGIFVITFSQDFYVKTFFVAPMESSGSLNNEPRTNGTLTGPKIEVLDLVVVGVHPFVEGFPEFGPVLGEIAVPRDAADPQRVGNVPLGDALRHLKKKLSCVHFKRGNLGIT